jgi:hypothetical protein
MPYQPAGRVVRRLIPALRDGDCELPGRRVTMLLAYLRIPQGANNAGLVVNGEVIIPAKRVLPRDLRDARYAARCCGVVLSEYPVDATRNVWEVAGPDGALAEWIRWGDGKWLAKVEDALAVRVPYEAAGASEPLGGKVPSPRVYSNPLPNVKTAKRAAHGADKQAGSEALRGLGQVSVVASDGTTVQAPVYPR